MILNEITFENEHSSYIGYLELFGALSYLFSASATPYIDYRIMENVFCDSFNANNLSRTDTAFDARKTIINNDGSETTYGFGLKTFTANMNRGGISKMKQEKIAEFNKGSVHFEGLSIKEKTMKIAELRNTRIESAMREYNIDKGVYHCLIRYHLNDKDKSGRLLLKEFPYEIIDIKNIVCTDKNYKELSDIKSNESAKGNLFFTDGQNHYSFNSSKSTLFKRFEITLTDGITIPVNKMKNPAAALMEWYLNIRDKDKTPLEINYVILPLYSIGKNKEEKIVPEKSGLNNWNAGGRKRKFGEMYIPVPSFIRKNFKDFFPARGEEFILVTPDNRELSAKTCQDKGKALMSNPNTALSEWFHPLLVRDNTQSIVTYQDLSRIDKDSVRIEKTPEGKYKFSLAKTGSWEDFEEKVKANNQSTKQIKSLDKKLFIPYNTTTD